MPIEIYRDAITSKITLHLMLKNGKCRLFVNMVLHLVKCLGFAFFYMGLDLGIGLTPRPLSLNPLLETTLPGASKRQVCRQTPHGRGKGCCIHAMVA